MQNNLFRIIIYLFILNKVSVMYNNFRVKFRQFNMGYWFKLKYDINMSNEYIIGTSKFSRLVF